MKKNIILYTTRDLKIKVIKAIYYTKSRILGPFLVSLSNFLLAISAISSLGVNEYGYFAFSLSIIQLSYVSSNALTATPMAVELQQDTSLREEFFKKFSKVSILLSILCGSLIFISGILSKIHYIDCTLLAIFGAMSSMRWYGRTFMFTKLNLKSPLRSDISYSIMISISSSLLILLDNLSIYYIAIFLIFSSFISIFFIGVDYLKGILLSINEPIARYFLTWRKYARTALTQVLLMEGTANAHTYLIMGLMGPSALAPIAISTLFWRPTSTVIASVAQVERPKVAHLLRDLDFNGIIDIRNNFWKILSLSFSINFFLSSLVLIFLPNFLPDGYNSSSINISVSIWGIIFAIRSARVPDTVFCQAAGGLSDLTKIGLFSSPISIFGILVLLLIVDDPAWSLIGTAIGEIVQAAATWRLSRRLHRSRGLSGPPVPMP